MKKLTLLTMLFTIVACGNNQNGSAVFEEQTYVPDSTLKNLEEQLNLSDTTIVVMEHAISENQQLKNENTALKSELKVVKDSLVQAKKLIKKRSFIQKVLGINKDTIQTVKDTAN